MLSFKNYNESVKITAENEGDSSGAETAGHEQQSECCKNYTLYGVHDVMD